MVIEVKNMSLKYKSNVVLKDVNVELPSKGVTLLVGSNGIGKTTFLSCICNLLRYEGTILVDGKKYLPTLCKFAASFDDSSLYPSLTGLQNIEMFESSRAASIASELGLGEKSLRSKVSTYSLGQTKKLSIAVALGSDANYVLLDEPSNGMDRPTLLVFERILRSVSATRAILIASHDLHMFADIADRVLLVKEQTIRDISTSIAAKIDLAQDKNVNDASTGSVIEALIYETI